ncbi:MAG: hypothetical protein WD845_07125, partial [Pirellulales bacterium]
MAFRKTPSARPNRDLGRQNHSWQAGFEPLEDRLLLTTSGDSTATGDPAHDDLADAYQAALIDFH